MKNIAKYILIAGVALFATACDKEQEQHSSDIEQMGSVSLGVTMSLDTRSDEFEPENLKVRIYNGTTGGSANLIRRYTSLGEIPNPLQLVAGSYSLEVTAGNSENVAFKASALDNNNANALKEKLCFESGLKSFGVTAGDNTPVEVECKPVNVMTQVVFEVLPEAERTDKSAAGYNENHMLSDVEIKLSASESVKAEGISSSETVYFLMPEVKDDATGAMEPETTISWSFNATHSTDGAVAKNGTITVEEGKGYKITFKYSKTPDGYGGITVNVDKGVDTLEDSFDFKPQPVISGQDIETGEEGINLYAEGSAISLACESINAIKTIALNGEQIYDSATSTAAVTGVTAVKVSDTKVNITLSADYFETLVGGVNDLTFGVTDEQNSEPVNTVVKFAKQGVDAAATECDLWLNTAKFTAVVSEANPSSVKVRYRRQGTTEWMTTGEATLMSGSSYMYTVTSTAVWDSGTENSKGKTIYTPNKDKNFYANNTYEYQLLVNDTPINVSSTITPTVSQPIPFADFENGNMGCWGTEYVAQYIWGSGNNSATKEPLCSQGSKSGNGGSHCAFLDSQYVDAIVYTALAAGNLFTGEFKMDGTTGTVHFGVDYDWKARPTALKLKLWHSIGTVDVAKYDKSAYDTKNEVKVGGPDQGSIYVAIVDWKNRMETSSGTKAPTGIWSVEDGASASSFKDKTEGNIIGYGVIYPKGTTSGDSMVEVEIPIYYYHQTAKPSNTYKLVIAAANSRYGDFMVGCKENDMYIDDFEWVY